MNHYHIYSDSIPSVISLCAETPAMQRLKNVGMNCGCEYTSFPRFQGLKPYSRYEHSLGVALIVWHFTGNIVQSVSGLLHDISTPVFAHVIDFLHGDYLIQEATEKDTEEFISASIELQEIFKQNGIVTESVKDYHRYPIADNDSPKLSADRLEYTIGNSINFGVCTVEEASAFYSDLTVGTNEEGASELMFRTREIAKSFAEASLKCSKVYVSDEDRYAMQFLSELLSEAIDGKKISEDDLYSTEPALIEKLIKDDKLAEEWARFKNLKNIYSSDNPQKSGKWRQVYAKKRYIDPFVVGNGRVSGIYPDFNEKIKDYLASGQDKWICGTV